MGYSIFQDSYPLSGGTLEAITSKKILVCSPTGGGGGSYLGGGESMIMKKNIQNFAPLFQKKIIYSLLKINDVKFWDLNDTLITYLSTSAKVNPSDWRIIDSWKAPPPLLYVTLFNNFIFFAWPFVILPYKLCLWCNDICLSSGGQ